MKNLIKFVAPAVFTVSFLAGAFPAEARTYFGGVDLNSYCRARWRNSSATLVAQNAWGWRCAVGASRYSIDVTQACREQHRNTALVAETSNPNSPYSWGCYFYGRLVR